MITTILFDFFGTLVDYRQGASGDGFRASFGLFRSLGGRLEYVPFLEAWEANAESFEREADRTHVEYPMELLVGEFLRSEGISDAHAPSFIETFIREWNQGVTFDEASVATVRQLSGSYALGVVTNTHLPSLVPGHLRRMGLLDVMSTIVTSVEVGRRKPHPLIFEAALERLGAAPGETLFVGDSIEADFRGATKAGLHALVVGSAGGRHLPDKYRVPSVRDLPVVLERFDRR